MSSFVFNIAQGTIPELFATRGDNGILILLEDAESDDVLKDYDTLADLLASINNTELTAPNYTRKVGLAGTVVVDDSLDEVRVEIADQTWAALGTAAPIAKAILAYELGASDAQRRPLTGFSWPLVPDGTNATLRFP